MSYGPASVKLTVLALVLQIIRHKNAIHLKMLAWKVWVCGFRCYQLKTYYVLQTTSSNGLPSNFSKFIGKFFTRIYNFIIHSCTISSSRIILHTTRIYLAWLTALCWSRGVDVLAVKVAVTSSSSEKSESLCWESRLKLRSATLWLGRIFLCSSAMSSSVRLAGSLSDRLFYKTKQ